MPKEVSNYMLRLVVEGGEFFGVSRDEQRSLLSDPSVLDHRWLRVDWEDLRALALRIIQEIGSTGWGLVEAGWRYRRDCFLERIEHLFWMFLTVEKGFWVTKHMILPRNLTGADLHYKKLGEDHFHIVLSIPESLPSEPDIMYLYTGVMTRGSETVVEPHRIENLQVTAHRSEFDIRMGKRKLRSWMLYNPFVSQ